MKKLSGTYLSAVRFSEKKQLRVYDPIYQRYTQAVSVVRFSEKKKIDKVSLSAVRFGWPIKKRSRQSFSIVRFSDNNSLAIQTYYQGATLTKRTPVPPSFEERTVTPASMAFIQLPDAGISLRIPKQNFGGGKISRGINKGISWDMRVLNLDGEFSHRSASWKNLLEPGFYSSEYNSRKFVCLVFARKVNNVTDYMIVPRLVMRDQAGRTILERGGVDEITFLLGQVKTFNSYVPIETLTRISSTVYESLYLTINEKNALTEFRIDDVVTPVDLNTTNRQWSFSRGVESQSTVQATNPIDASWCIDDICKKVIDSQAEKIKKEYFKTVHKFPPFRIYNTIQCQGKEMISIIKYILQAIGGAYRIKPVYTNTYPTDVTQEKLTFETFQVKLPTEYETFGKFYTPETIMSRPLEISSSGVDKKNAVKVKSPSRTINVQVKQTTTIYSEVQREVPVEPIPATIPAGSTPKINFNLSSSYNALELTTGGRIFQGLSGSSI